jgi:uncharacterized membrane-anchored protein YitT (DUF2179 family)
MLSKVIGFILTALVAFGMSLLLIPVAGIAFGLIKKMLL